VRAGAAGGSPCYRRAGRVEYRQRRAELLVAGHDRRQQPDDPRVGQARGEQQSPAAGVEDRQARLCLVAEFDCREDPRAANVGYHPRIGAGQPGDAHGKLRSERAEASVQLLEQVQGRQARRTRSRMPAERRGVEERIGRERREQLLRGDQRGKRHDAAAERFAKQHGIRREPLGYRDGQRTAPAKAALNLVSHDERPCRVRVSAPLAQQAGREDTAPSFALHGFEDQRRERGLRGRTPHGVRLKGQVPYLAEEAAHRVAELGAVGDRERAHALAVESAADREHAGPSGVRDGELERGLYRVGAVQAEPHPA
jgi:hypothetical protein